MAEPVVVIGGGLAGMAAAARLAKQGYSVELYEASHTLGGTWAPYEVAGVVVDDAPSVLGFPAPWRDLFRKSGRPLEAELERAGYALAPAEPLRVVFADGRELAWPSDRGGQYATLAAAYGERVAAGWRDLIDRLSEVWQTLRPLGLEAELPDRSRLPRAIRKSLDARRTLADLATDAPHPHLAALLRSTAYRAGSTPDQTPAMVAVEWAILRTFGRWQLQARPDPAGDSEGAGRSSILIETLAARLALRKVAVHLDAVVTAIQVRAGRASGVTIAAGERPAAAVISTADPWGTDRLLPARTGGRWRRRTALLRPAQAPAVSHQVRDAAVAGVSETLHLTAHGVPILTYCRPTAGGSVVSVHDYRHSAACPAYGVAWRGFDSWTQRPPVTTETSGLFLAGPWSAGGPGPSQVVLTGALAAYGTASYLGQPV